MPNLTTSSSTSSVDFVLSSCSETEFLGQTIGRALRGGEVLALIGDLGAGKTSLVRGIAAGLGTPPVSVSSPTFVLVHEYEGRLPLIHVDLYRLHTMAEAESIGLSDYLSGQAIIAVEWADRFPMLLPEDRLNIRLAHTPEATRTVRITGQGARSLALLYRIKQASGQILPSPPRPSQKSAGRRKALKR